MPNRGGIPRIPFSNNICNEIYLESRSRPHEGVDGGIGSGADAPMRIGLPGRCGIRRNTRNAAGRVSRCGCHNLRRRQGIRLPDLQDGVRRFHPVVLHKDGTQRIRCQAVLLLRGPHIHRRRHARRQPGDSHDPHARQVRQERRRRGCDIHHEGGIGQYAPDGAGLRQRIILASFVVL